MASCLTTAASWPQTLVAMLRELDSVGNDHIGMPRVACAPYDAAMLRPAVVYLQLLWQVCFVAAVQQEPYLLLGCTSGAVRVAGLVNASGELVSGTRPVRGLTLLPYSSECLRPWYAMWSSGMLVAEACSLGKAAVSMAQLQLGCSLMEFLNMQHACSFQFAFLHSHLPRIPARWLCCHHKYFAPGPPHTS